MSRKRYELIATAFDKKGRVIGAGINDYKKSHPLMRLYSEKSGDAEEKIFKHAELAALLSSGNKQVHSMLIQRFDVNGEPAMSMPCMTCQCMLRDFGVKEVQYTTKEGIKTWHPLMT